LISVKQKRASKGAFFFKQRDMGKYLNVYKGKMLGDSFKSKMSVLLLMGAEIVPTEGLKFEEELVCLVDNGPFAAAAWAHTEAEFNHFMEPDPRARFWFRVPDVKRYVSS
jgi:hypothetical protein